MFGKFTIAESATLGGSVGVTSSVSLVARCLCQVKLELSSSLSLSSFARLDGSLLTGSSARIGDRFSVTSSTALGGFFSVLGGIRADG